MATAAAAGLSMIKVRRIRGGVENQFILFLKKLVG